MTEIQLTGLDLLSTTLDRTCIWYAELCVTIVTMHAISSQHLCNLHSRLTCGRLHAKCIQAWQSPAPLCSDDFNGVFRGRWCNRHLGLIVNFWMIWHCFCISFVISRLNCKIRVPWLPCFLPVKKLRQNALKLITLGTKNDFFLGMCPAPPPHPLALTPTEILNTPLQFCV